MKTTKTQHHEKNYTRYVTNNKKLHKPAATEPRTPAQLTPAAVPWPYPRCIYRLFPSPATGPSPQPPGRNATTAKEEWRVEEINRYVYRRVDMVDMFFFCTPVRARRVLISFVFGTKRKRRVDIKMIFSPMRALHISLLPSRVF